MDLPFIWVCARENANVPKALPFLFTCARLETRLGAKRSPNRFPAAEDMAATAQSQAQRELEIAKKQLYDWYEDYDEMITRVEATQVSSALRIQRVRTSL